MTTKDELMIGKLMQKLVEQNDPNNDDYKPYSAEEIKLMNIGVIAALAMFLGYDIGQSTINGFNNKYKLVVKRSD